MDDTMKLHLPSRLFRAVIALMVAVPSAVYAAYTTPTEIVIPELYATEVQVDAVSDISAYANSANAIAFRLIEDVGISAPDYVLMEPGLGSFYFTSHAPEALKSLSFSDNTACLFNVSAEKFLEFIALQDVSFNRNTGPIHGERNSIITLNCNEAVTFSENTSSSSGGAIYGNSGPITLSDNGTVTFSENTSSSSGGAIYGYSITLSNNGTVTFSENTSSSAGGAIYGDFITLSDNDEVSFTGNTASSSGGAICKEDYAGYYCTITLSNNGTVNFSENTASSGYGGAIYGDAITLSNNDTMTFSGNSASSGGAIFGHTITLSNNGTVNFSGNTASFSGYMLPSGGAIYGGYNSTITLSNNDTMTFSGNSASFYGGAIYGDQWSSITLSNNGTATFSGNSASAGGAIYGNDGSTITLSDNGTVSFSGNSGGAIYSYGNLHIRNNDSVEFAGNVEKSGSTYRLRSIYVDGGSGDTVSLSAAEGKSIIFRDSMYIGSGTTVDFNADYTDAEGNILAQKGDILFTGATTEADLLEAKGSAGTAEEILNSRTTEVKAMTNLYGGRLRVEDGSVYQGQGITVHEGSEATVRVKDATLNHKGYSLSFASGTKLEVEGSSTISGNVVLNDGAAMSVSGTAALDGGLSLKSGATAASLEGVSLISGQVSGNGESARMQDVWMEGAGEIYGITGVAMENVHFSAALATLTLANVIFDTDCSFSVGAEGSIILSNATLRITLPEAGNGGIYRVDLSHLFQCTVEGDLSFDVDTEALVAAGYTGVEFDFGSDADEDYSNLTLSMDGATYEGTEGNVAGFTLPTIPEPSTATLSLLALAALASRRRRG